MTRTLDDFKRDFTARERAGIVARTAALIEKVLTLRYLRRARHPTQERMTALMGVEQENVSRLQRRVDLLLSTLSSYTNSLVRRHAAIRIAYRSNLPWRWSWILPRRRETASVCVRGSDG